MDHNKHEVVVHGNKKATLNAPLLDWIFKNNPNTAAIVHYHKEEHTFPTLPYAIPGTVNDSQRTKECIQRSFNIATHGVFLLLDKTLQIIHSKVYFFWITFVPLAILLLITGSIGWRHDGYDTLCNKDERWRDTYLTLL